VPAARLPGGIFPRETDSTGSIASGNSCGLIEKKHPMLYVAATGDGVEGGATVEAAVNPAAPMAAE